MNPKKHEMPTQSPEIRKNNFNEVALGYTPETAVAEAKRCLNCKHRPCVSGCPVKVRIPDFIAAVAEERFEDAYKIITASGYPSYREWIDRGATTLWEMWDCKLSKNHHMYSDVLSYIMKTVAGISPDDNAPSFDKIVVSPYYFDAITFAAAHYDSPKGRVKVDWKKKSSKILLVIYAPCDNYVVYKNTTLKKGKNKFVIKGDSYENH